MAGIWLIQHPFSNPISPCSWWNLGLIMRIYWTLRHYKMTKTQGPRPGEQNTCFPEKRPEAAENLFDGKLVPLCRLWFSWTLERFKSSLNSEAIFGLMPFLALPDRKVCLTFIMSQRLNCSSITYICFKDWDSHNAHVSCFFWTFGMVTLHCSDQWDSRPFCWCRHVCIHVNSELEGELYGGARANISWSTVIK